MKISTRFSFNSLLLNRLLLALFLSVFAFNNTNAQCPTITSDGIFNPDSDVVITSYHQTIARTENGYVVWGEDMESDGTDALALTAVTPANGYTYAGTPIHSAVSGNTGGQAFLATTTSLYAWGLSGEAVDGDFVTGNAFDDMDDAQTLPFTAADITQLHASSDVLFVLASGEIWVATTDATSPWATGNANTNGNVWQQVETSAGVPLTGVVNITGNKFAGYALLGNGDLYAWGDNVELGNGGATQDLSYATQMTAPPVAVTYISSYTDNVNTTSEDYPGASVITAGATPSSPKLLYTWGESNNNSIGQGVGITGDPTIPPSFNVGTDDPVSASIGGHATTFFNRANGGSICFVGHIIQGSTGGLTTGTGATFECVIPNTIELCGAC